MTFMSDGTDIPGTEHVIQVISPVSTNWKCTKHGTIRPATLLVEGRTYTVCTYCLKLESPTKLAYAEQVQPTSSCAMCLAELGPDNDVQLGEDHYCTNCFFEWKQMLVDAHEHRA